MLNSKLTRRQALTKIYQAIIAVGASSFISFSDVLASTKNPTDNKPNIIWLHGTSCSGCSTSLLDIELVPVVDILTRFTNVIFHPDISLATGEQVPEIINRLVATKQKYVFVFEGGIPVSMPHACLMADKPITEWVDLLAANAEACIAAGTCAVSGGVPKMNGTLTGSHTLEEYLHSKNIKKPVVNLPNCPMKPEHFVYTALHYAKLEKLPELDSKGRPVEFFSYTNHERCHLYSSFQEKDFAHFIGDSGCLLKIGCQGPVTYNDCLVNGHNNNTNTCIRSGHPCIGCASEHFPRQIMMRSFNDTRSIKKKF